MAATMPRELQKDAASEPRLRVLVVDDDPDSANILGIVIGMWGHEVHVAYGAQAGLELAQCHLPDVRSIDLAEPRIDGFALARLVRQDRLLHDTILLALTGYADEFHRQ